MIRVAISAFFALALGAFIGVCVTYQPRAEAPQQLTLRV